MASSSKIRPRPGLLSSRQNDTVEARLLRLEADLDKEKRESIFFHGQLKELWALQKKFARLTILVEELQEECQELRSENMTLRARMSFNTAKDSITDSSDQGDGERQGDQDNDTEGHEDAEGEQQEEHADGEDIDPGLLKYAFCVVLPVFADPAI